VLALALALVATTASAQKAAPLPAFSLTRFTLNDGGRGALTAATGDTLPNHRFRATLALHYENNPLVYFRNSTRVGALVAHRVQLHIGLGFGITSWLQVTGELPIVVAQTGDDLTQLAGTVSPDSVGMGSPRLAVRLGILSHGQTGLVKDMPFDLAFQLGFALPFGVGNALAQETGFNLTPQLSLGRDLGPAHRTLEADGLLVTNYHVIADRLHEPDDHRVEIVLSDGTTSPCHHGTLQVAYRNPKSTQSSPKPIFGLKNRNVSFTSSKRKLVAS
jgi:hypothetical protein